ncbi:unnamed protein product [Amoebophrya sp. A25]|nr:unnamed protein product [Amoebophrya sp. A25]|eukprot:GSA25T00024781001.1
MIFFSVSLCWASCIAVSFVLRGEFLIPLLNGPSWGFYQSVQSLCEDHYDHEKYALYQASYVAFLTGKQHFQNVKIEEGLSSKNMILADHTPELEPGASDRNRPEPPSHGPLKISDIINSVEVTSILELENRRNRDKPVHYHKRFGIASSCVSGTLGYCSLTMSMWQCYVMLHSKNTDLFYEAAYDYDTHLREGICPRGVLALERREEAELARKSRQDEKKNQNYGEEVGGVVQSHNYGEEVAGVVQSSADKSYVRADEFEASIRGEPRQLEQVLAEADVEAEERSRSERNSNQEITTVETNDHRLVLKDDRTSPQIPVDGGLALQSAPLCRLTFDALVTRWRAKPRAVMHAFGKYEWILAVDAADTSIGPGCFLSNLEELFEKQEDVGEKGAADGEDEEHDHLRTRQTRTSTSSASGSNNDDAKNTSVDTTSTTSTTKKKNLHEENLLHDQHDASRPQKIPPTAEIVVKDPSPEEDSNGGVFMIRHSMLGKLFVDLLNDKDNWPSELIGGGCYPEQLSMNEALLELVALELGKEYRSDCLRYVFGMPGDNAVFGCQWTTYMLCFRHHLDRMAGPFGERRTRRVFFLNPRVIDINYRPYGNVAADNSNLEEVGSPFLWHWVNYVDKRPVIMQHMLGVNSTMNLEQEFRIENEVRVVDGQVQKGAKNSSEGKNAEGGESHPDSFAQEGGMFIPTEGWCNRVVDPSRRCDFGSKAPVCQYLPHRYIASC